MMVGGDQKPANHVLRREVELRMVNINKNAGTSDGHIEKNVSI